MRHLSISLGLLAAGLCACATSAPAQRDPQSSAASESAPAAEATAPKGPPMAERRPHVTKIHGLELSDDWFWLRHREDPAVIDYLKAENSWADAQLAHTKALQKSLYDEMLGHIVEDDSEVPVRKGDYFYYSRTAEGKAYPIHCRRKGSMEAPEEVLLDVNALAEGHEYTAIGVYDVSPNHEVLAYSVDFNGSERYELRFRSLKTGEDYPEKIADTYYTSAWGSDNRSFFYLTVDGTNRPFKLFRHSLGTEGDKDALVHHEKDEAYYLQVRRSRSGGYVFLSSDSAVTSEVLYVKADAPTEAMQPIAARSQGVEYGVEHQGDAFLIRTNEGATNFKLMRAAVNAPQKANWTELIPHREAVTINGVAAFADHIVLFEREAGLPQITIRPNSGEAHRVAFEDASYDVWLQDNPEYATSTLRFFYTSLVQPRSVYDYDVKTRERTLRKEKPVKNYTRESYVTERIWATAKDGVKVPISLVYKQGTPRDGSAPLLLNGYGSYGSTYDPYFTVTHLPLLDRGMVVGIAHIRGGGEMGRSWKEDGKFEKKKNTFTDFIACAEHLVAAKYTQPGRLAIRGGSAGGLLMGAVTNMRPDLFRAVLALVPFVDVVNTMLDATIPLTVTEWDEWGNPNEKAPFEWIRAYSPYDNVTKQAYPAMLIRAGLNDPRVQYWEPAKWTAKLRAHNSGDKTIVLVTNMGAGHGGASGRYGYLEEKALDWAFVLDQLGAAK